MCRLIPGRGNLFAQLGLSTFFFFGQLSPFKYYAFSVFCPNHLLLLVESHLVCFVLVPPRCGCRRFIVTARNTGLANSSLACPPSSRHFVCVSISSISSFRPFVSTLGEGPTFAFAFLSCVCACACVQAARSFHKPSFPFRFPFPVCFPPIQPPCLNIHAPRLCWLRNRYTSHLVRIFELHSALCHTSTTNPFKRLRLLASLGAGSILSPNGTWACSFGNLHVLCWLESDHQQGSAIVCLAIR
jgi:hypothetical protein